MSIVPWSSVMSVKNDFLDSQHKILLGTINEIYAGVVFGRSVSIFKEEYPRLLEYANIHFGAEEELMRISGYDGLGIHKQQHDDLRCKLLELSELGDIGEDAGCQRVCFFLNKWLTKHMMGEDQGYVDHIAMLGHDVFERVAQEYNLQQNA